MEVRVTNKLFYILKATKCLRSGADVYCDGTVLVSFDKSKLAKIKERVLAVRSAILESTSTINSRKGEISQKDLLHVKKIIRDTAKLLMPRTKGQIIDELNMVVKKLERGACNEA